MSNKPNMKEAAEKRKEEIYENKICAIVGQEMEKLYPGWRWWIECRIKTGLVAVRNLDLDGDYGCYIPILNILHNPDSKMLMRAGGEILERYKQDRAKRRGYIDVERDIRGNAILTPDCAVN
jgi:hypothetical protein